MKIHSYIRNVCTRYTDFAYTVRNSKEFIKLPECIDFKTKAFSIAKSHITHHAPTIRQAAASFLFCYGQGYVWNVFCNVLAIKHDYITLSHISEAVGKCYYRIISKGKDELCFDIFDNNLDKSRLISYSDAVEIKNALTSVLNKVPISTQKSGCKIAITELDELLLILTKQT